MRTYAFVLVLGLGSAYAQLKVLHLSFHTGCIQDVEYVAVQLHLNLTSWHISGSDRSRFDGIERLGNDVMNIGPLKAKRIWDLNKEYFNQFDVIITSDTAPLARIFFATWVEKTFNYLDMQ